MVRKMLCGQISFGNKKIALPFFDNCKQKVRKLPIVFPSKHRICIWKSNIVWSKRVSYCSGKHNIFRGILYSSKQLQYTVNCFFICFYEQEYCPCTVLYYNLFVFLHQFSQNNNSTLVLRNTAVFFSFIQLCQWAF